MFAFGGEVKFCVFVRCRKYSWLALGEKSSTQEKEAGSVILSIIVCSDFHTPRDVDLEKCWILHRDAAAAAAAAAAGAKQDAPPPANSDD